MKFKQYGLAHKRTLLKNLMHQRNFIKSDGVNESSRTNESQRGRIFPEDHDIVRRILYTKYVRAWAIQLNDMEKKEKGFQNMITH